MSKELNKESIPYHGWANWETYETYNHMNAYEKDYNIMKEYANELPLSSFEKKVQSWIKFLKASDLIYLEQPLDEYLNKINYRELQNHLRDESN